MDHPAATMSSDPSSSLKRPRSPTEPNPLPAAKIPRTTTSHLQINYLVRQHKDTIPLVTVNEKLPEIARLLSEYDGVIQRHESMAGNLGACPLGPILLKRFERLFDGPPRVLKSHAKDGNISWLDVVEFAQSNPKQFNLERTRNGVRVCQFYTKQCRVEISEEDFVLIASGMPQKLIPPQPILEDEEKELGVMDLLDRNLGQVIQLADQVSGRARQLIHKMKGRRTAILSRREQEAEARKNNVRSDGSPLSPADTNGVPSAKPVRSIEVSQSPPVGFTAVNLRQLGSGEQDMRRHSTAVDTLRTPAEEAYPSSGSGNVTIINGKSIKDASPSVRAEMMKNFLTPGEREAGLTEETVRRSSMGNSGTRPSPMQGNLGEKPRSRSIELTVGDQSPPTVAIPNTPASLMPHLKPSTFERDDGGPFKSEMVRRMDNMWKGDRVIPPCDRCRRLHMDCLKNLTACMGCTKKHAKCSWKEVKASELQLVNQSGTPDREPAPTAIVPETAPMSASSTIEVNRPSEELIRSASIAQASLDLASDNIEAPREERPREERPREENPRPSEDRPREERAPEGPPEPVAKPEAPLTTPTARFDVRPPPLVPPSPDVADHRSHTAPTPTTSHFSPYEKERVMHEEDDDDGDRLQALAARVYRSASQSGHRPL